MKIREWLVKNRRVFTIWFIVAAVVEICVLLYFKPWGPSLGVAASPRRWTMAVICDWWLLKLPLALLGMSIVAERPKWLAPPGRYQEGQEYPVFSTYTYAAVAFMAALFAAAGILHYEFFDMPAAPAAISVTLFNPIIGFFTLWIGGVARSLIFGTGNPVYWATGVGLLDGCTWIWLGIFYWLFRESKWGKNAVARIIFWIVIYWIWRPLIIADFYLWLLPVPALWGKAVNYVTQFLPSGTTASVAGLIISEALRQALERGRRGAPEVSA